MLRLQKSPIAATPAASGPAELTRWGRRPLLLLLGLLCVSAAGSARGQGADPGAAAPKQGPAAGAGNRAQTAKDLIARADEYTRQGRWDAALGLYLDAYRELPNPSVLLAIGLCHVSLNHPEQAQSQCDAFEAAVPNPTTEERAKLDQCRRGTFAVRKAQLGQKAYEAKEYEAARQAFESAYALYPVPGFLFNVAQCYQGEQRWAEMLDRCEAYERALGTPGDPEAQDIKECKALAKYELDKQQCLALMAERRYEPAVSSCRVVFDLRKDPALLLRVGVAQAELKQCREAKLTCDQYGMLRAPEKRSADEAALLAQCERRVQEGLAAETSGTAKETPKKPLYKRPAFWVLTGVGVLAVGVTVGLAVGLTPQPYREFTW